MSDVADIAPVALPAFAVPAKVELGWICRRYCAANAWWMLLPLLGGGAWALVDVRWGLDVILLWLVALTLLLTLLILNHALSPAAVWSVMPKSATFDRQGIVLSFEHERKKDEHIAWDDVLAIDQNRDYLALTLRSDRYAPLLIPRASLADPTLDITIGQLFAHRHQ